MHFNTLYRMGRSILSHTHSHLLTSFSPSADRLQHMACRMGCYLQRYIHLWLLISTSTTPSLFGKTATCAMPCNTIDMRRQNMQSYTLFHQPPLCDIFILFKVIRQKKNTLLWDRMICDVWMEVFKTHKQRNRKRLMIISIRFLYSILIILAISF